MNRMLLKEKNFSGRKTARPISLRGANHITLKANAFVLRRYHVTIKKVLCQTQRRYGVKLNAFAIMGNHIHFCIRVPSRKAFADAMRFLAGKIAVAIEHGKLWICRVWSRPITSRRDLSRVTHYIALNPFKAGIFDPLIDELFIQGGILRDSPDLSFWATPSAGIQLSLAL